MNLRRSTALCFFVLAGMLSAGCGQLSRPNDQPPTARESPPANGNADLPFGNPSNAIRDPANSDNYLVTHNGYVLSYNDSKGTMNWVSWRTSKSDLGPKLERPLFQPDMTLPGGIRRVQYYDYSGSGFDRGHMVPSADRFSDKARNNETFLMTNIVPQTHDLNEGPWQKLEMYARNLAGRGNDIYQIAGVYGEQKRFRDRVTVPTNCWKVIVVLSPGTGAIDASTRIIAVDMRNIDGILNTSWRDYRTSVRELEQKTGLDLFSVLSRDVQDKIETRVDFVNVPTY